MLSRRILTLLKRSYSEKAFHVHWVDEYRGFLQMKAIKFKYWMTVPRTFKIAPPLVKPLNLSFSISDLAGNLSFIFLALSYLESEFMNLRAYALSGITMSIIFQYYRERPLWIPIRWNSVFLLINGAMLLVLFKEKNDANNIPDEQKFLFQTVFQSKGMKSVDYLHLINSSKRLEFKKGDKVVKQDELNTRVCLVKKGKLMVARGNEKVGTINQNQFVGAMSFLTWSGKVDAERAERAERQREEIRKALKLQKETPPEAIAIDSADGITMNTASVAVEPSMSGVAQATPTATNDSNSGNGSDSNEGEDDGSNIKQSGWADVVVEEDCVVFSWDFCELKELTESNPQMGMILERCISEDLNRKMANNWQDEPKNRYKQLLTGALMDGEITPEKRAMIQKCRQELHINDEEHLQVLHMVDWTNEQFEAGYKESPPTEVLAKYIRSVKRCCESDEGFTEEDRNSLRRYRLANNISYRRHLAVLKQLGWTADQYEAGTKAAEILILESDKSVTGEVTSSSGVASPRLSKHHQQHQQAQDSSSLDGYYYAKRLYNFFSTGNPNTSPSVSTGTANLALTGTTVATSRTASPIRSRAKQVFGEGDSSAATES